MDFSLQALDDEIYQPAPDFFPDGPPGRFPIGSKQNDIHDIFPGEFAAR
jgi:hypothetical protein